MINVICILPPKQPKQKKNAQKHCTVAVIDLNGKKTSHIHWVEYVP